MIIENSSFVYNNCYVCSTKGLLPSLKNMRDIASIVENNSASFILLKLSDGTVEVTEQELLRMCNALEDSGSAMLYSDFRLCNGENIMSECECIDYQYGSVRDDFDFGSLVIVKTKCFISAVKDIPESEEYDYAGWYLVRLMLSLQALPFHLNEYLYSYKPVETDSSSQFDYVNPRNRGVQIEYEKSFTSWLKKFGSWTDYKQMKSATPLDSKAHVMASVVIPVFNRVKTVKDAVTSALSQECSFDFNVIVVDNHSTDGTTEVLKEIAASNDRLVHVIPEELTLKIGGCWNKAVFHEKCGNFIVQLDSDDIYSGPFTLQKMVDAFIEQDCMAVVGSYRLTDFDLNELPPGVIDHKEWTPENGMNNALRINGLGAPRGFRRDLLRQHPLPNTSYGEDYAAMLRICREYRIGRIYDSLYDCRRWSGNSDAALSREKINRNNLYKDRIRTIEILARKK